MGFFRQDYWGGLLFPPLGNLPDPGIEPTTRTSPALAGGFFITEPPGKPILTVHYFYYIREVRFLFLRAIGEKLNFSFYISIYIHEFGVPLV